MADEIIATDNEPEKKLSQPKKKCCWFFVLVLILFAGALGFGTIKIAAFKKTVNKINAWQQKELENHREQLLTLENHMTVLQQKIQQSQQLFSQQEQLVNELRAAQKGGLEKWHVAEAQYLVKLANDHIQFKQDLSMAENLLQRAAQVLQETDNPKLFELRQSIANDLAALQAFPKTDVTNLYLRLLVLDHQLDQLSLPEEPLTPEKKEVEIISETLPWWKRGLTRFWQSLSQIVVVRYTGEESPPVVLPQQKIFLYQNLHAQMENAMWGLLHRNLDVYQQSLDRAQMWVRDYFAPTENTQTMLQSLQGMRQENIHPPTLNLTTTLQLFDNYFLAMKEAGTS